MHICLISVEIFAWGKYGGIGRATRILGRELVKAGIEVSALVPRRGGQQQIENLDGIRVLGFDIRDPRATLDLFRSCQADIYHSQEPSLGTYLAQRFHPKNKHVVTFRDTRLFSDWLIELRRPSLNPLQVLFNWAYEDNPLVHAAVRRADACGAAANLLSPRAVRHYHLAEPPPLLATPVEMPAEVHKAHRPTVCYIGRWDRRKRPDLLAGLVRAFPQVDFIIAGGARDPAYGRQIRASLERLPNVELPGFINQFESDRIGQILSKSWITVNTAAREGLPNSFIEACAHRCAILSSVDPDDFSSRYGYFARQDDFAAGLEWLLADQRWRELGERGFAYVDQTYALPRAVGQHIALYQSLMA